MNAENLHLKDGTPTRAWYCTKCHVVAQSQEMAESCCRPAVCEACGQEMNKPQSWRKCDKCRSAEYEVKRIREEKERFEAATKVTEFDVTEFDGWVYCDHLDGHNEGFFESLQELIDFCQDEEELMPDYCWACNAIPFVHIDISDELQNIEENGYEDFDADDCNGIEELKKAVNAFNEVNTHIVKYEPNYDLAVILPPEVVAIHKAMIDDARGGEK